MCGGVFGVNIFGRGRGVLRGQLSPVILNIQTSAGATGGPLSQPLDVEGYFARIGYHGPRAATLEVLRAVVLHHSVSIPFENLDVLLGRGIGLDLAAVHAKLVNNRRGGYCFEQNSLLLAALESLGFMVAPLSARVRIDRAREFLPPRTHLFLRVELDGVPWLADVGVGGLSPTGPLRMDTEAEQDTPHEPRRIVRQDGRWFHQARLACGWVDVCEFTGEQMPPIDRELANWWTSTNPGSKFQQNIMASIARRDGTRVSFQNTELTHRKGDGSGEVLRSEVVSEPERLREVLAAEFGIVVPEGTRFGLFGM